MAFLPITKRRDGAEGWDQADLSGDRRRLWDHPSFGAAIISRASWRMGFRVAVLPQPDWRCDHDFMGWQALSRLSGNRREY